MQRGFGRDQRPNWERTLMFIGRTLDARGSDLVDVAITVDGEHAFVSALQCRSGPSHDLWAPCSQVITLGHEAAAQPSPKETPGLWATRLRTIGGLLDDEPAALRDVCVFEVDGGVIVEGLVPSGVGNERGWRLVSRELANAVIAPSPPEAPVRTGHRRPTLWPRREWRPA